MPTENRVETRLTPMMSAEAETQMLVESRPVRVSGFLALLLGLLSFTALLGAPMMLMPVLAVLAALIALRPYAGQRPVGHTAAMVGLFAAVLFGMWGATARHLRHRVLTDQAATFAATWLDLIADGELEMALQLYAYPTTRHAASMDLREYYTNSKEGREAMRVFREDEWVDELIRVGNRVNWQLARPPEPFLLGGQQMVASVWQDQSGIIDRPLKVTLEYFAAEGSQRAQWKVDRLSTFIE